MNSNKELNFEINILPVLDILSVLICFLLLTAVWIQVGSLDTKQSVGEQATAAGANPPSLWISVSKNGTVTFSLRDLKTTMAREQAIAGSKDGLNWAAIEAQIRNLKASIPDLKTVIVRPEAKANYGDVVRLMDQLKKNEMNDIGLSPVGAS